MDQNQFNEYHKILGTQPGFSPEQLKAAWRKKCAENHPDKGGNSDIFLKIMHAYKMLSDAAYRHEHMDRETDLTVRIQAPVAFEDAFFGHTVTLSFNRVELDKDDNPMPVEKQEVVVVKVRIPAGSMDGYRHFVEGKGLRKEGADGDVVIDFKPVQPKGGRYSISGADVHTQEKVPLSKLLKGGKIEVVTMWGIKTCRIPAGTQPGAQIKIKKCGVQQVGCHVVTVQPMYPTREELKTSDWKGLDVDFNIPPEEPEEREETDLERVFQNLGAHRISFTLGGGYGK